MHDGKMGVRKEMVRPLEIGGKKMAIGGAVVGKGH